MVSKPVHSADDAALIEALGMRLSNAILPGDAAFSADGLAQAAQFVLATAAVRTSGDPAIAIESVSGGASERFMRIAVINDDMPFLVDSISGTQEKRIRGDNVYEYRKRVARVSSGDD